MLVVRFAVLGTSAAALPAASRDAGSVRHKREGLRYATQAERHLFEIAERDGAQCGLDPVSWTVGLRHRLFECCLVVGRWSSVA